MSQLTSTANQQPGAATPPDRHTLSSTLPNTPQAFANSVVAVPWYCVCRRAFTSKSLAGGGARARQRACRGIISTIWYHMVPWYSKRIRVRTEETLPRYTCTRVQIFKHYLKNNLKYKHSQVQQGHKWALSALEYPVFKLSTEPLSSLVPTKSFVEGLAIQCLLLVCAGQNTFHTTPGTQPKSYSRSIAVNGKGGTS